ncbi:MAG: biotin/lipoyl-binding protein [Neomegalonema sp.]|nr:biotin/lipoyl-binding protein [Neomegalonema sp.]
MFQKILIANRGEIACRVIRTARRMGVATVAVYSDADAGALHVELADEAVHIGPAAAAESYLKGDVIIAAAQQAGAQAIHPGYGFLSENPAFVAAVEAAGLRFIGPSSQAINAMGLKDAAKRLMQEAGVPVVPGYHGEQQSAEFLAGAAAEIGYPVLIKARAGGGGKGMRKVDAPSDFVAALESAQREAASSFGDDRVLIEKFVTSPRHIEVQVFGDDHGDAVHLFERDCSLQRRHQKVIEEAPAPGMTTEMREAMGAAAVRAAKAIGYSGAGTVEFIVDGSDGLRPDRFYFMEMNTRLQVEHPVTEAVLGLDLVEWQLRVAAGERLPVRQSELRLDGWAFEARLYAEDAAAGFLPATGRLLALDLPETLARIDSGVRSGDEISPFYDPMIAKIIAHGPSRAAALGRLRAALAASRVVGTVTNLRFLEALAAHEGFARGEVDTGVIDRDLAALTASPEPTKLTLALAGLAALGLLAPKPAEPGWADPFAARSGWRAWAPASLATTFSRGEERLSIRATLRNDGGYEIETPLGAARFAILTQEVRGGGPRLRVRIEDNGTTRDLDADVILLPGAVEVRADGGAVRFDIPDPLAPEDSGDAAGDRIAAPMPGVIKAVFVVAGAEVSKGQALAVLEAMKMEHTLAAPRDGVVAETAASVGDQVEEGELLLALAPAE